MMIELLGQQTVSRADTQRVREVAALARNAAFNFDLDRYLRCVEVLAGNTAAASSTSWAAFSLGITFGRPELEGLAVHLCKSRHCSHALMSPYWHERRLSPVQVRSVLGGIGVAEAPTDASDDDDDNERGLSDASRHALDELVFVTTALPQHAEILDLSTALHGMALAVPRLRARIDLEVEARPRTASAGDISHILFHWCTETGCTVPPATGRYLPASAELRSCGQRDGVIPRSRG